MAKENNHGQTEQDMMASGKIIKQMAKENSIMSMVTFSKGIGIRIRQTDMEFIFMLMGRNMKVIGKMIYSMDSELRHGMMDPNTKGIT